jgi:hypothetical protein
VFRFEGVEGNVLLNQERRTCDGPAPGSDNSLLEVEIGGGDSEDEDEDGRGGWCSCNVVIYQPRNEGLMVVICIRVQEGTGMGLGQ